MPVELDLTATAADVRAVRHHAESELMNLGGVGTEVARAVVEEVTRSAYASSLLPTSRSHGLAIHELRVFLDDPELDDIVTSVVEEWGKMDVNFSAEHRSRLLRLATRRARRVR